MFEEILKEAKWIGKTAEAPISESWLEKEVVHTTPEGKRTRVKVKSLPPEEKEKYRPKKEKSPEDLINEKKKKLKQEESVKQRKEQLEKSTGNDYSKADLKTLNSNMENNLKRYDDPKIQIRTISSKEPLTSKNWMQHKTAVQDNAKNTIKKYAKALAPDSQRILGEEVDRLSSHIEKALNDGSLKTSPDKIDSLIQDSMKIMIHQEVETKRRALGDHGVRHIISNSKNTQTLLDELEKGGIKVSGAERLASSIAQMNHDVGYSLGAVATDASSKGFVHKEQSASVFNEGRAKFEEVLGKDLTDKTHNWIATHDDIKFDWKQDPVASSIRFADTMSLFGSEKLPEIFLKSGKTTKVLTKMKLASQFGKDLTPYKDEMKKIIDTMDSNDLEKEEFKNSIDEINAFSVDDFLARHSGKLKGFKYNKGTGAMEADVAQSPEHELIQSLFNVGQKKFKSLDEDLSKENKVEYVDNNRNSRVYKDKDGAALVQINLVDRDKDPINQTANEDLKDFYSKSIRHHITKITNELTVPPSPDAQKSKKLVESISKDFGEPHKKLINKITDMYLNGIKESGLDKTQPKDRNDHQKARMKRLTNLFTKFPLTKSENEWMQSKTASKIARLDPIQKTKDKAKKLVKNLEKIIKRDGGSVKVKIVDSEKKLGFDNDKDYYVIAILTVRNIDWLPVEDMTLIVNEDTDIILRLGDSHFDVGELYWVGYWSGEQNNRDIAAKFNGK